MPAAAAAQASRSCLCLGTSTPDGTPPTWWLARPIRWMPDATDGGASTWMTWSTAPMSMPSSSDDVATMAGNSPALSRSSVARRVSFETEPWCANAISSPAVSFNAVARRSASRRLLTKIMVERALRMRATSCTCTCGQMLRVAVSPSPSGVCRPSGRGGGTSTVIDSAFFAEASTIATGRGRGGFLPVVGSRPPSRRAISSSGLCVADSPMRWIFAPGTRACRRSSDTNRCEPRLLDASWWISSMITVSTDARISRCPEVRRRYNDSGVVIRTSGGARRMRCRSACGVSPVRTATSRRRKGVPSRDAASNTPASGARRLRSTSTASALSGDT